MISVYCDGSSTGRSGREGGWAYVITFDAQPLYCGYGGSVSTTNNLMELEAAIQGLLAFEASGLLSGTVELCSDSRYVLGMASGRLAPQKNLEKVTELQRLYSRLCTATRWIRGHSGNRWNERCDSLAKRGKAEALMSEYGRGPADKEG